jgi:hypothetical protein
LAVLSYNVLDCVSSPYDHLKEIARLLEKNAKAIVSYPYDWIQGATPVEAWIGGYSQQKCLRHIFKGFQRIFIKKNR